MKRPPVHADRPHRDADRLIGRVVVGMLGNFTWSALCLDCGWGASGLDSVAASALATDHVCSA